MVKPASSDRPPPRPGPPPGSRLPAGERRASILAAAFPRFAVHGFEGTTTRDLARAAGVTEPVLYRHFPSKEALFAAVLEEAAGRLVAALDAAVGGARGAGARLEALAERLEPLLAAHVDEFRVLNGAAATRPDAATAGAVREAYRRLGERLVAALDGDGLRPGVSAETAGHLLLEMGLGASLARPLGVPGVCRVGYGREVLALLLSALTARGRPRPRPR